MPCAGACDALELVASALKGGAVAGVGVAEGPVDAGGEDELAAGVGAWGDRGDRDGDGVERCRCRRVGGWRGFGLGVVLLLWLGGTGEEEGEGVEGEFGAERGLADVEVHVEGSKGLVGVWDVSGWVGVVMRR